MTTATEAILPADLAPPPATGETHTHSPVQARTASRAWAWVSLLLTRMEGLPQATIWLLAIVLIAVVGYADYATGYEVSIVMLYSLPILLMVRFGDSNSAVFISLLCALTWWWADEGSGHHYTTIWHQIWETTVRLGYFLIFVFCGTSVKARIELLAHADELEREIIRISEREQQRIGQDLHDGLCQYFAAVACSAGSIKGRLERTDSPETASVQEMQELILDGVQQTRSLARGLFPVQDDEWGLPSALTELAASTRHLQGIRCDFHSEISAVPIRNDCSTHLFRIAQEALSNAVRHGHATAVAIRLALTERSLLLTVEDNGAGIPEVREPKRGLGLTIMQYRAREIGGRLSIERGAEGGTRVACEAPLSAIASEP